MEIKFRSATENDIEPIINLCNECFEEKTDIKFSKQVFNATRNDKNQIYLVGELENEIIAHTKITIIPTMFENMKSYSILNHVCVKPEFRRHNIATKMLEECEKISKSFGCVSMVLWSMNYRIPAHECYKQYGFVVKDAKFFSKKIDEGEKNENK